MENAYYVTAISFAEPNKRIRITKITSDNIDAISYLNFCKKSDYFNSHFKDPEIETINLDPLHRDS